MKTTAKGISFVGTLVVLVGALIAASMAAVIIISLFNAMSTQPYVVAGEAYYINATNFTHFHVLFYNVGKGSAIFEYMYIYVPTNISGKIKVTVAKVIPTGGTGLFNGIVINNSTGAKIGDAIFNPYPPVLAPQGGNLDLVAMINNVNVNVTNITAYPRVVGIAVFNKDSTIVLFETPITG